MTPDPHPARRFPEDLAANLRLAEALAPTQCAGCGGYHLERARRRLTVPDALDRGEMVGLLRDWAMKRSPAESTEVVIVGSADTNLLAVAADAVADLGPARYTVLDRCRTPLSLCEAFARQHGLQVETSQFDAGAPGATVAADAVIVHSLLRFLPESAHLAVLDTLKRWLKPGGAILFSHRLMPPQPNQSYYKAEYKTLTPLLNLFRQAGLEVTSLQEAAEAGGPRRRVLALLTSV